VNFKKHFISKLLLLTSHNKMLLLIVRRLHTLKARVVLLSVSKPVYMDQMTSHAGCWELDKTLASMLNSFISNVNDVILDSTLATSAFHHGLRRGNTPSTALTTAARDLT